MHQYVPSVTYGEKAIYRYNGHGDVIALNAPNGDMIAEYAYDEFGQVIEEQAAPQATPMVDIDFSVEGSEEYDFPEDSIFDNPYRYAGYEYLDEVELYDLNARYYDPSIARFLTEDPYYNLGNRVMGVYEIGPTSLSVLQYNLENDNLPVARIGWQNDQGHFILIVGVINVNGEYGVLYNDPWNGVQQYLPFEKFSGEGTLQDGTWTHTALTYKK